MLLTLTPVAADRTQLRAGIRAVLLEDTRWHNCHVKSTSLLGNLLLRRQALAAGAAEALLVRGGELDMGHARALLGLEDAGAIRKLAQRAVREGLSVRATEALVRLAGMKGRKKGASQGETPAIRALASRLQRRLGARVRVVPKSAVSGRLEVDYTSLDELDGILAKIGA